MDRSSGLKSTIPGTVGPRSLPNPPQGVQQIGRVSAETAMTGAERQLAPYVQTLASRVEALEAAVRSLQQHSIQQRDDGKLYLPAGNRLRIEIGNTRLTMDSTTFTVEANGRVILSAPLTPVGSPTQAPGSGQGIAAHAGRGQSWQSVAAQNATEDPRALSPGQRLNLPR